MASTSAAPTNAKVKFMGKPPQDDYEAQDAARMLARGQDIQSDPALMKRVHKHATAQSATMAKVAELAKRGLISYKQAAKAAKR